MEVVGANCLDAWKAAVTALRSQGAELFNLRVTVEQPCVFCDEWFQVYDPRMFHKNGESPWGVSNLIFPIRLASRYTEPRALYKRYTQIYSRTRRRRRGQWGTYFHRLIAFGEPPLNQLDIVINKLASWDRRSTAALVFHLSGPHLDKPRTRGGPCWQYGELLWHEDNTIDLVAVYRNHDYFNKALPNLIALGQLLAFICKHSNRTSGKLVCHSVRAYHEGSKSAMNQLLEAA